MSNKPLIKTNPYLRDPKKLEDAIIWSVATSTAIETRESPEMIARRLKAHRYQTHRKRRKTKKAFKVQR